jgi:hypothetical protein
LNGGVVGAAGQDPESGVQALPLDGEDGAIGFDGGLDR